MAGSQERHGPVERQQCRGKRSVKDLAGTQFFWTRKRSICEVLTAHSRHCRNNFTSFCRQLVATVKKLLKLVEMPNAKKGAVSLRAPLVGIFNRSIVLFCDHIAKTFAFSNFGETLLNYGALPRLEIVTFQGLFELVLDVVLAFFNPF